MDSVFAGGGGFLAPPFFPGCTALVNMSNMKPCSLRFRLGFALGLLAAQISATMLDSNSCRKLLSLTRNRRKKSVRRTSRATASLFLRLRIMRRHWMRALRREDGMASMKGWSSSISRQTFEKPLARSG